MGTLRGNIREALRQLELLTGTGSFFFVHSGTGSSGYGGTSPEYPVATINQAVSLCTANKGDVIVVMPGHAESLAAAGDVTISKAGVTVVGLGNGTNKPVLTFGTATTATFLVSAVNVRVRNLRFVGNIDDLATFISGTADYLTIEDCEFVTSSTKEALAFITFATTKDYLTVRRCRFEQPTDPAGTDGAAGTGCIYLVDSEYILVEDCWFAGNFETAIIHNKTTACKHLWVRNCFGIQALSGAEPFQLVAGATGATVGGGFITPAETAAVEATLVGTIGDGFFTLGGTTFGNDGAAGGQGGIIPATAS